MTEKTNHLSVDEQIQRNLDARHELLIDRVTRLLSYSGDQRYWPILKLLISMRSSAQIERMKTVDNSKNAVVG